MSLPTLVNRILGRNTEPENDGVAEPQHAPVPKVYHASSRGKTRAKAEKNLMNSLPAPLGSDVYVEPPEIGIQRVGKKDWHGTASYRLKDVYQPPSPVQATPAIESGGLASKVTATTPLPVQPQAYKTEPNQAKQSPHNQARAVPARATGYSPSALEQQLQQRQYR